MSLILSGTDGLSDVDGSAATPAIRGTDANTGIFFPAADTIAFSEGGAEAMRIDSSGNVGIATTLATTIGTANGWPGFVVGSGTGAWGATIYSGATSNSGLAFANGTTTTATYNGYVAYNHNTNAMTFATNAGTERMRITSAGDVGIGTTTPLFTFANRGSLTINGTNQALLCLSNGSSTSTSAYHIWDGTNYSINNNSTTGSLVFGTNAASERMRITLAGDLLVGTSSGAAPTASVADIIAGGLALNPSRRTTASAGNTFWSAADGYYYRSTSSLRYKINVQDYGGGLIDIAKLRPVKFNSKPKEGEENPDTHTYAGFIAEEVHDAGLIEFVTYAKDGSPDALSYANMVSLCVKAIQEQQALIQSLTARITALETP